MHITGATYVALKGMETMNIDIRDVLKQLHIPFSGGKASNHITRTWPTLRSALWCSGNDGNYFTNDDQEDDLHIVSANGWCGRALSHIYLVQWQWHSLHHLLWLEENKCTSHTH